MFDIFDGNQWIVLGMLLVATVLVLRRRMGRAGEFRRDDPLTRVRADFTKIESSPSGRINQLEVRLHEYAREVEGRIQSRTILLEQLLADADRDIRRLEELLAQARESPPATAQDAADPTRRAA
jgi:hypothetical protein